MITSFGVAAKKPVSYVSRYRTSLYYMYRICTILLFFISLAAVSEAQINVTSNQTANTLAQKLVGQGITITNATLTCPAIANGTFKVVTSNLGLDSGIILTSGRAATSGNSYGCNGPQVYNGNNANASTSNGAAGDAMLNSLANATTHDACRLEFDLVPKGDSISFNYVFGSEEYWKSTCGIYNDAFGFFISGPNIVGTQNMALVPGTNIPVTVNSVNSGVAGIQGNIANCHAMGPGSPFPAYYIDNVAGATVTYYGFTKVLSASHAVTPCSTYHLIMTIADAGNFLYDSGVFIEAGSLKTAGFNVTASGTNNNPDTIIVKGCAPGKFTFTRSLKKNTPQTLKFFIDGTAVNGTDYAHIADSVIIPAGDSLIDLPITALPTAPNGATILKIRLISPYSCNGQDVIDSAYLKILDVPLLDILTPDTAICIGGSVQLHVLGSDSLTYSWSPATGLSDAAIKEPVANPSANVTYTLTGNWLSMGCPPLSDQVTITINPLPQVVAGPDTMLCLGSSVQLYTSVTPPSPGYIYSWQGPNSFTSSGSGPLLQNFTALDTGAYTVQVNTPGCPPASASLSLHLIPPIIVDAGADLSICTGTQVDLDATATPPSANYIYQWTGPNGFTAGSAHATIPNITIADTGVYTVAVSGNGCPPVTDQLYINMMSPITLEAGSDTAICAGETVHFYPVVTPAAVNLQYHWSGPSGFSSTNDSATVTDVTAANDGLYVLAVMYPGCVPVSDSVNVTVKPAPAAPDVSQLSPVYYCQNNDAEELFVTEPFPLWYSDTTYRGSIVPPTPNTSGLGVFSYYVSQVVDRCEGPKSAIKVVVQKCCDDNIMIPTAFSPNGDGHNDVFRAPAGVNHRLQYMYVYNRFGQLVFSSDYDHQSWDGTFKGQVCDVGVYYYYLSIECKDGAIVKRNGDVTLVR